MPQEGNNYRTRYEDLVLGELRSVKEELRAIRDDQSEAKAAISALRVQAGIWGGLAGLIPFGLFVATRMLGSDV